VGFASPPSSRYPANPGNLAYPDSDMNIQIEKFFSGESESPRRGRNLVLPRGFRLKNHNDVFEIS
jgi:hypothetical protein